MSVAGGAALLCAGVGLAGAPESSDRGAGPKGLAEGSLDGIKRNLARALEAEAKPDRQRSLQDAIDGKSTFVHHAYRIPGQGLQGCNRPRSAELFGNLESTDVQLTMAVTGNGSRIADRLDFAARASERAATVLRNECPDATADARAGADRIAERTAAAQAAFDGGQLGDEGLKSEVRAIENLKRELFAGEVIADCEAFTIYSSLKEIDVAISLAFEKEGGSGRDREIKKALSHLERLTNLWKRAPCDTACSDRLNNDSDTLRDRNDPGCLSAPGGRYDPSDQSEEHHDPGINCATIPVAPGRDTFIGLPNSGSKMVGHILRSVTDGTILIEQKLTDSNFTVGGPIDLGERLCGPGTTATVEWVRNGMAISWHLNYYKDNAGVTPAQKQIIAAANTRGASERRREPR